MTRDEERTPNTEGCVLPPPPMPADELGRYGVERDFDSEQDIARYVEIETRDETVQHVERIKTEIVLGDKYIIWDVTTDKDRYWVLTNLTNLYPKRFFPSLDYTLSFHIGLMMRMRSRPEGADAREPSPFDEVFRRQEQAKYRLDHAVEAEDVQAVGLVLRECLLSLAAALRRRVELPPDVARPKDADFIAWSELLIGTLCPGSGNKELRQHVKNAAHDAWQLVGWLTHDRNADRMAGVIAVHSCDTVVGHMLQILERNRHATTPACPACNSRELRSHYDMAIPPDGDYYMTCGACGWSSHPGDGQSDGSLVDEG